MKKLIAIALCLALLFCFAGCGGAGGTMTMGTGGTAGTYYGYGGILGTQIKTSAGITVNVVSTDGSKANILGIDQGNYQLGTVQSDVMAYAYDGTRSFEAEGALDSFRVIGGLYAEAVQLVTMDPEIKSVADLAGKKVSIGAAGSGVYFNAIDILGAAGLAETDIQPQYQSFADSADALKDGKIDAAFIVAGAPTPAIHELCTTTNANEIAKHIKNTNFGLHSNLSAYVFDKTNNISFVVSLFFFTVVLTKIDNHNYNLLYKCYRYKNSPDKSPGF